MGAGRCEQRCGNAESKEEGRLPRHAHLRTCAPAHHTPHTTHTHARARTATMSSLLSFLGGAPKAAGPSAATKAADTGNALQKITDHIEILDKKAEHMQKKADAERQQAVAFHKKGGAMNKKRAMQHLKLAKQYDNQIENQFKMQDNLQAQVRRAPPSVCVDMCMCVCGYVFVRVCLSPARQALARPRSARVLPRATPFLPTCARWHSRAALPPD